MKDSFLIILVPSLILSLIGRDTYSLFSHVIWFLNLLPFIGALVSYTKENRIDYYLIPSLYSFVYYVFYHFAVVAPSYHLAVFIAASIPAIPSCIYLSFEAWRKSNGG